MFFTLALNKVMSKNYIPFVPYEFLIYGFGFRKEYKGS